MGCAKTRNSRVNTIGHTYAVETTKNRRKTTRAAGKATIATIAAAAIITTTTATIVAVISFLGRVLEVRKSRYRERRVWEN